MGGEVIIEFAVFLVRSALRKRKLHTAAGWTVARATARNVSASDGQLEVLYTYEFDGSYFCNYDKRDFFWSQSAKDYESQIPLGSTVPIKVNPENPQESVLLYDD